MWKIPFFLFLGIVIGFKFEFSEKFKKYNSKLQHIGVVVLLFIMGIGIGANRELLSKLNSIGFKSLTFAVFTSVGSVLAVYLVTSIFLKGEKK